MKSSGNQDLSSGKQSRLTDRIAGMICAASKPVTSSRRVVCLGIVIFVCSLACFIHAASRAGILNAPPARGGDESSYERLGYNLACGLGYGYCPADQAILSGESEVAVVKSCEAGCTQLEFSPTAYRPPGFPLLVAAVNRISPMNFLVVRLLNCVFCAAAVAIVGAYFAKKLSLLSGLAVGVLCSIDPRFREFAGTFLTENLATLTFCLFALALVSFFQTKTTRDAVVCGFALSALVIVRSFYVAWYPILWICVGLVLLREMRGMRISLQQAILSAAGFGLASLLLTGPWWVRNCLVLDALMPTGTQGGIGIADGFSDSAYANFGSWTSETADRIASEMRLDPSLQTLSRIEFEKEHSRRGSQSAKAWIRKHPELLMQLSWWKFSRLWEYGSVLHGLLFGCCFLGLWYARDHALSKVLLLLFVLNSLTVVATYHTYERFMTPFRPLIHGLVGFGCQMLLATLVNELRSTRSAKE